MMASVSSARRLVTLSVVLTFAASCGGDAGAPVIPEQPTMSAPLTRETGSGRSAPAQRTFTLELTTPHTDDGGLIVEVSGPNIESITPSAGLEVVENRVEKGTMVTSTLVVRGDLSSGVIAQLTVRGVNAAAPYSTKVLQAAAGASGGYAQRADLSAYRVTVQR